MIIPPGGDSEPDVVIKINGVDYSQRVGVEFEADATLQAVIESSHLMNDASPPTVVPEAGAAAAVVIDFKNGAYSIGGVSQTQGQVLVEDSVDWGYIWDGSKVVAGVGFKFGADDSSSAGFVLTAAALAAAPPLGVCVVTYRVLAASAPGNLNFLCGPFNTPVFDVGTSLRMGWSAGDIVSDIHPYNSLLTVDLTSPDYLAVGAHKAAFRVSTTNINVSVDGGAVAGLAVPHDYSTIDAWGMGVDDYGSGGSDFMVIEKIEFYALADYLAADLAVLSA